MMSSAADGAGRGRWRSRVGAGARPGASYPDRAIRFVGGFPPGGPTDLSGRMLAQSLSEVLGQQVVIENKSGAAGNIASAARGRGQARRLHLLMGTSIMSIVPALYDKRALRSGERLRLQSRTVTTVPLIIVGAGWTARSRSSELVACCARNPASIPTDRRATAA